MTFDCGVPALERFQVHPFEPGILRAALELCGEARDRREIVDLLAQAVDEKTLKNYLGTFTRYCPSTLRLAYWMSPQEDGKFLALRDKSAFLSDPLLSSLVPISLKASATDGEWLPAPQSPGQQPAPFGKLLERRPNWFAGVGDTTLGRTPIPSAPQIETLRRLAEPSIAMRRSRWQLLQLLQAYAAIASNRATIFEGCPERAEERVLALQQLALLQHDVRVMFPDQPRPEVDSVIAEGRATYDQLLRGTVSPRPLRRPSEMPQAKDYA